MQDFPAPGGNTMYLSIIADNVGDRKHLERLIGRAGTLLSDKIGTIYEESFGDFSSVLSAPMKYELFIIDIPHDISQMIAIARHLHELDVKGSICICLPETFDTDHVEIPVYCYPLKKPIAPAKLHDLLIEVHTTIQKNHVPTIEIRSEHKTHYVPIDHIVYAKQDEHLVYIYLIDQTVLTLLGNIYDFSKSVEDYEQFHLLKHTYVINYHFLSEKKNNKLKLTTGTEIKLPFFSVKKT